MVAHRSALAAAAGRDGWLADTARFGQADIAGVIAYSFVAAIRPD